MFLFACQVFYVYKYWITAVSLSMKINHNSDRQVSSHLSSPLLTEGGQTYMCVENMRSKNHLLLTTFKDQS